MDLTDRLRTQPIGELIVAQRVLAPLCSCLGLSWSRKSVTTQSLITLTLYAYLFLRNSKLQFYYTPT